MPDELETPDADGVPLVGYPAESNPRPLTPAQRKLLDKLAAATGVPEIIAQVKAAQADADCLCGCSSVRLITTGPAVDEATVARLSPNNRPDYVGVQTEAFTPSGQEVALVLHVLFGFIEDFEVFYDEGVQVDLETLTETDEFDFY